MLLGIVGGPLEISGGCQELWVSVSRKPEVTEDILGEKITEYVWIAEGSASAVQPRVSENPTQGKHSRD